MDVFNISNILATQRSAVKISIIKGMDGPMEYYNYISAGWEVSDVTQVTISLYSIL